MSLRSNCIAHVTGARSRSPLRGAYSSQQFASSARLNGIRANARRRPPRVNPLLTVASQILGMRERAHPGLGKAAVGCVLAGSMMTAMQPKHADLALLISANVALVLALGLPTYALLCRIGWLEFRHFLAAGALGGVLIHMLLAFGGFAPVIDSEALAVFSLNGLAAGATWWVALGRRSSGA